MTLKMSRFDDHVVKTCFFGIELFYQLRYTSLIFLSYFLQNITELKTRRSWDVSSLLKKYGNNKDLQTKFQG